MNKTSLAALVTGMLALIPIGASAQESADNWKFSITPYLWLPSVTGDLNYGPPPRGGGSPNVTVDASKLLEDLNFAAMFAGSAQKGQWLLLTDFMYLDLSGAQSKIHSVDLNPGSGPINVSTASLSGKVTGDIKGTVWTFGGGYSFIQEPKAHLDLLAGVRYLGLEIKTNWNLNATVTGNGPLGDTATFSRAGSVEQKENIWTPILGARGRFTFGDSNWFGQAYLDAGGNSSTFTWQGAAGVGYGYKWGEILLDYRYLYYSQNGNKDLIDNMSFGGPALGATFHF